MDAGVAVFKPGGPFWAPPAPAGPGGRKGGWGVFGDGGERGGGGRDGGGGERGEGGGPRGKIREGGEGGGKGGRDGPRWEEEEGERNFLEGEARGRKGGINTTRGFGSKDLED